MIVESAASNSETRPLTSTNKAIAAKIGPTLREKGLVFVGLDVIGEYVTEINVTSPTCFREITDQTGFDVAALFVDALEEQVKARASQQ